MQLRVSEQARSIAISAMSANEMGSSVQPHAPQLPLHAPEHDIARIVTPFEGIKGGDGHVNLITVPILATKPGHRCDETHRRVLLVVHVTVAPDALDKERTHLATGTAAAVGSPRVHLLARRIH
jgi:hypothetical protein